MTKKIAIAISDLKEKLMENKDYKKLAELEATKRKNNSSLKDKDLLNPQKNLFESN